MYYRRLDGRLPEELRPISFIRNFTKYAEGSVLVCYGNTKVICNASVLDSVPRFLRDSNSGWISAEYSMLPRSTLTRTDRDGARGIRNARSVEIQRLIGRSLRVAVDLSLIPKFSISLDCDVLQADGGTRTAAISGAYIALVDAINWMIGKKLIKQNPIKHVVTAVSVGVVDVNFLLDLDYKEDSSCCADINVIMSDGADIIEVQGTAESLPISKANFLKLLDLAHLGISQIIKKQNEALALIPTN